MYIFNNRLFQVLGLLSVVLSSPARPDNQILPSVVRIQVITPNGTMRGTGFAVEGGGLDVAVLGTLVLGGDGENHTGPSPRKSTYGAYTQAGYKKVSEGPGATLGPGPKAGPEGVTDNVYVKDFKYKLVNQKELNKKAKGIEVKQLWGK